MINIKGAAGLAKRAINRIVIAITNCYRTAGGQGLLFIYREICPRAGYTDALQTAHVTKIVSRKQPTDPLQRCLRGVQCTAPRTGRGPGGEVRRSPARPASAARRSARVLTPLRAAALRDSFERGMLAMNLCAISKSKSQMR